MIAERPNPVNDSSGNRKIACSAKENGAAGFPVAPFSEELVAYFAEAVCAAP